MAVNLSPVAGAAAQFFDNSGQMLTGGKLYTYLAGTTTPAVTYTTNTGVTPHANPIVLNAAGRVPDSGEIWLTDSISYKFVLKDQNDVLIATYDNLIGINSNFVNFTGEQETQTATQGQTIFTLATIQYIPATNNLLVFVNGSKQIIGDNYIETSSTVVTFVDGLNVGDVVDFCTAVPINANVTTAADVSYNEGDTGAVTRTVESKLQEFVSVLDFGADPTGVDDCTDAIQNATNSGKPVYFPAGTYKIVTGGISYTGTVVWYGEGAKSIIESDAVVITVNSGDNSSIDNLYMQNITAPWIITRNPSNWATVPTVVQSNGLGYQPTVNDTDVWSSLTTEQQDQNIGPQLLFQGNASGITVSRIYGRFVSVIVEDAQNAVVRDCNFQAGKNFAGGVVFWNINDQQGEYNQAINNNIQYASYNGIIFARNYDGLAEGNICTSVGESGIKTYQGVIGATDARCYRMQLVNNNSMYAYYDGFDFSSDFPHTGTIDARHLITSNTTYGNRQTGFFADGLNTQFISNQARFTGKTGFALSYNQSLISNNLAWGCNQSAAVSGEHQMYVNGNGNAISNNYLNRAGVTQGYALFATGTNLVENNYGYDGTIFLGNPGAITAQYLGNIDTTLKIEGTFSPRLIVGSTVQSTSYAVGNYTRIGHRVFVDVEIALSALTGTGNPQIDFNGGIPIATGQTNYASVFTIQVSNCTYTGQPTAYILPNFGSVYLGSQGTGTAVGNWTEGNLTSSSIIRISGSYVANQ
jgi:hypothetical protein